MSADRKRRSNSKRAICPRRKAMISFAPTSALVLRVAKGQSVLPTRSSGRPTITASITIGYWYRGLCSPSPLRRCLALPGARRRLAAPAWTCSRRSSCPPSAPPLFHAADLSAKIVATLPSITDLSAAVQAPGLLDDPGVTWGYTCVRHVFQVRGDHRRRPLTTEQKLAVVEKKRQTERGLSTWKPHEQGRDPRTAVDKPYLGISLGSEDENSCTALPSSFCCSPVTRVAGQTNTTLLRRPAIGTSEPRTRALTRRSGRNSIPMRSDWRIRSAMSSRPPSAGEAPATGRPCAMLTRRRTVASRQPSGSRTASASTMMADELVDLAHGAFRPGVAYDAWIRFSNGDADPTRADIEGDGRGMALKLLGVPGRKLLQLGSDDDSQDFIMISHPVFFIDDPADYLQLVKGVESFLVVGAALGLLAHSDGTGRSRYSERPRND